MDYNGLMGLVRENIEFRRGIDSKRSLGIGAKEINKNWMTMMDNLRDDLGLFRVRDWTNRHIYATKLIHKWTDEEVEEVRDWIHNNTYLEVLWIKKDKNPNRENEGRLIWMINIRVEDKSPLGESIEFKRGQDSKKAMAVGKYRTYEAPFNWKEIPVGNYKAIDDERGFGQACYIQIKRMGVDTMIRQKTYWGDSEYINSGKSRIPNQITIFAEDWFKDNDFVWLELVEGRVEIFESINFTRGKKSKDSLGVGVKETNRDLETLAQNFKEHFDKYTFLAHNITRREPRWKHVGTDKFPMYFRMAISSMEYPEFELDRKRRRFRAWFKKNTPYILKSIKKGSTFINSKSPSGYQRSYTFYIDDK